MHEHLPVELVKAARNVIAEWELESMTDVILGATQPQIRFECSNRPKDALPRTFAGGLPEMPSDLQWPRCENGLLPFIAQIDLAAIPALPNHPLPRSGFLYFFYWCTNETEGEPCRVLWADCDAEALKPTKIAETDILPDWQGVRIYEQERTASIKLGVSMSECLLEQMALESGCLTQADLNDDELGDFPSEFEFDVELELAGGEICLTDHMLWGQSLGYVPLEELLGDLTPSRTGYRNGGETWLNLLQVMSGGNMLWSDAGCLAFLIEKSKLEKCEFDLVRARVLST